MNTAPLRQLLEEHHIEIDAAHSLLDATAMLGELARRLLKATDYGRQPCSDAQRDALRAGLGDVTFALAHLGLVLGADLEEEMLLSVARYEALLRARSGQPAGRVAPPAPADVPPSTAG